ncbi:DUF6382 domain-containing protein [Clostridium cibarium]|uniref:FHA domain-containing protein n=1 Tax=Clostridium cibarium TaxID=2762247 RepID=A0ABR8PPM7_9CLOT|nr:FHA domain-containing protein [Clostridium cibarium]
MTNLTKEIVFVTNTSSNKNYLVTNFNALELIDFQIEMVNRNVDGGFLPIEKRQFNSEIQLYYETTSLIPIDSYFRMNRISRKNFLDIVKNLCGTLVKSEEQYLSVNNYVLDLDKIYISKENLQVKYIYIPIEKNYNLNVNDKFKNMIKDIIVDYANIDDTYSDHYLQKMLNFLKREKTTIKEFYDFFLSNVCKDMGTILNEQNNMQGNIGRDRSFVQQPNIMGQNLNNNPMQTNNNPVQMNNNQFKPSNNLKKSKADLSEKVEVKEVYKTVNIIISIVMVVVTACLAVLAFIALEDISQKLGVVLIIGVLDFLALRNLLDKKKKIKVKVKIKEPKKKEEIKKNKTVQNNMSNGNVNNNMNMNNGVSSNNVSNNNGNINNGMPNNNVNTSVNTNNNFMNNTTNTSTSNNFNMQANNNMNYNMQNINNSSTGVNMNSSNVKEIPKNDSTENYDDETVLLTTSEPYLLVNSSGKSEKIYINTRRFRLGRLSTQVDYAILNKAVGKIHAEIINQKGMYYIVDLNSKNGTFINKKRIISNSPQPLKDKDEIMLADSVYTFRLY